MGFHDVAFFLNEPDHKPHFLKVVFELKALELCHVLLLTLL